MTKYDVNSIIMASRLRKSSFSLLRSKAQNPPEFVSRGSTVPESKNRKCGLQDVGLQTGSRNLGCHAPQEQLQPEVERPEPRSYSSSLLTFFQLIFFFAALLTKDIVIGSHNFHGFKTSVSYHRDCIENLKGIWFGQELWLSDRQLPMLHQLNAQFVARSGMEEAATTRILSGRPHGGVSIAWSPDLDHVITPVANFRHKRVVAVELETANDKFLLLSIYMPFFNSSTREVCLSETIDALSIIELLIDDHPQHQIIIGGDLNTELKGDSTFDPLWRKLVKKKRLAYCSDLFSTPGYTYHHASLGHKKKNDHFIVSQKIIDDDLTKNHKILEDGANLSDHLPIMMEISLQIPTHRTLTKPNVELPSLRWNKLSVANLNSYTSELSQTTDILSSTRRRYPCPGSCHCDDETCRFFIQQDYEDMVQCIKNADVILPRYQPGVKRDWWTVELSDLKRQSIDIENLWLSEGKPQQGPTHIERLRVRGAYRRAIRAAQRAPKQASWNKLHSAMEQNDTSSFWNSWRSLYNKKNSHFPPVVDGCSSKETIAEAFKKSFEANSVPNNQCKVDELNARFSHQYCELEENHGAVCKL